MRINHGQLGRGWSDYVPSMDLTNVVVMIMIILIIKKKRRMRLVYLDGWSDYRQTKS